MPDISSCCREFGDHQRGRKRHDRLLVSVSLLSPLMQHGQKLLTANVHSLRRFLAVRGATLGDFEMREVSALIYKMLLSEAASMVADFQPSILGQFRNRSAITWTVIVRFKAGHFGAWRPI
jgi:hypothetical protein